MQRANVWTDLLRDVVPEDRLQDAFRVAFQTHDSTFPINAYEVKLAWEALDRSEREEKARAYDIARRENPVKYCLSAYKHINGDGDVEIVLGGPNGKTVVIPCPDCRTAASHTRLSEEKAKYVAENPGADPLPKVDEGTVINFIRDYKEFKRQPETALEILSRARNEATDALGIQKLSHAIAYLYLK